MFCGGEEMSLVFGTPSCLTLPRYARSDGNSGPSDPRGEKIKRCGNAGLPPAVNEGAAIQHVT